MTRCLLRQRPLRHLPQPHDFRHRLLHLPTTAHFFPSSCHQHTLEFTHPLLGPPRALDLEMACSANLGTATNIITGGVCKG
uniref:Uncharacterized protein n=1 Tax=Arundo donax TaxID=35708 RepID=A0A0A8Y385_ARUDO